MRKPFTPVFNALGVLIAVALAAPVSAREAKPVKPAEKEKKDLLTADALAGLELRGIGPALTSGRIVDIAVDPAHPGTYYVAAASGGLWKTSNSGTTFTPVFDKEGSYSIGCVTVDPKHPLTVWVGTGENNSQRSVGYGDGVYRSVDGGKKWENLGLKASEHISKILIDPRDSQTVYVAAQGPLWAPGGDRGLYKTTDGGKTWKVVLKIGENTGANDVWMDPRDPDVLYASTYQRRRHVWTLIDGGPESGIYKSLDAGANWRKLENGLPKTDMGRIGLAVSPARPDVIYAIVEASEKAGGFHRSTDGGANWEKMSDHISSSPQYYNRIFADPKKVDRVYSVDVWIQVTEDGGKTFKKLGEHAKHVDNHTIWINPDNTDYLLAGCDGGLYETFDRGSTWSFKANLPITQFYRVALDNAQPFYNVYGGTQDNFTLGGPSRTSTAHGILNSDWFVALGGDGFKPQIDPEDPNVVYAEFQNGGLARFDRRTGERLDIRPQPAPGEPPLRLNWDAPLIISPHSHTRLYFGAQRLFRSDDRGESWRPVSPDLTRQIDRNKLKVMGRVWSVDAIAKNASTSFYGNLVSLTESPKKEGLLYVGSDDGLIQVTEDAGGTWRKIERVPGVPEETYVSDLEASRHDADTVYAAFDNHKKGDFKAYLLKSNDRGRTWTSISGDLPERGTVYTVAEDHQRPDLLFAGTEFGLYVTADGGKRWVRLKGNLPTIAVRHLEIQRRENDLVLATFGRGFYILDDYTPLRNLSAEMLSKEASLFPVKRALMYIPSTPLGLKDKSFMGDSFFSAANPPFGAVFTYYVKEELKTRKKARRAEEKKIEEKGGDVFYPSWDELRAEDREEEPSIILTVTDDTGAVVRRITGPVTTGFHRVAWDLRHPAPNPTELKPPEDENPFIDAKHGPLVLPGSYTVSMAKRMGGTLTPLGEPQTFTAEPLWSSALTAPDRLALQAFAKKTARLQRSVLGAVEVGKEAQKRLDYLKQALLDTPSADPKLADEARALEGRLKDLSVALSGDTVVQKYNEPTSPSIVDRVQSIVSGYWGTTSGPTATLRKAYEIASGEFTDVLGRLRVLLEKDLGSLEARAEKAGAPWTPGRIPSWSPE
jgi:photosystem II stability/assembly factor-like uncharacterized protein